MQSIPFILDEDQGNRVQEEIEMASVLLIALSRQKTSQLDALVKVNYPFRVYSSAEGNMVFDLLGLSKAEKKWLLPYDVSDILAELENTEDSQGILGLLNKGIDALDGEPNYGFTWVNGMIEQDDVKAYILDSIQRNNQEMGKYDRFKPTLTKDKFSSIRKNLRSVQKEITGYIESTDEVKERFETRYKAIKKTQEKNLSIFNKESAKRLEEFSKEKDKAIQNIEKSLKKEAKAIDAEYKERQQFITTEIDAAENEISKLMKAIEAGATGDEKRRVSDLEKLIDRHRKDIKALEDELQKRLSQAEKGVESEKQGWEIKSAVKANEEKKLLQELLKTHAMNLTACDDFLERIGEVKETMMKNRGGINNILDIKYENGEDLYLPFYILKYGDDSDFCHPMKVSKDKDMRKMLRLLLANNLENKIGRYLQPQTEIFDETLKMAIASFIEETDLFDQYQEALQEINLLETREALDKMVVGLYKLLGWGWIGEKDYIEVQRTLVERIDLQYGGNLFQVKEQVPDNPIESSEVLEVAASE